jgi:hypothetical protein
MALWAAEPHAAASTTPTSEAVTALTPRCPTKLKINLITEKFPPLLTTVPER